MTVLALIYGLLFAVIGLILFRRSESKPKALPWITGICAGFCMFVSLMTGSMLRESITQIANYTLTNILMSLGFGLVGYISGQKLARRIK
jgi:drug/metabolite transporter (DMT)-like permease